MSAEIDSALVARAEFLQQAELPGTDFLSFPSWLESSEGAEQFAERLSHLGGTENPWFYYMRGHMGEGDVVFGYAVTAAADAPGTLWLLALEFIRYNRLQPATDALTAIEKWIFAHGGSSAPFLSQQLMLMGNVSAKQSSAEADFCYTWAKRFDRNQCWWLYKKGMLDFPGNLIATAPEFFSDAINVFLNSWRAQVALINGVYRFFSAAVFIFTLSVFLVFTVKYLVSGVHTIGDTLFFGASPRYRVFSGILTVLSTLMLGPIFTMWVIAFLICGFLSEQEKKLLVAVCALLALCSLDSHVTNFLRRPAAHDSTSMLLERAIREGYSESLHGSIEASVKNKPDNHASQLALAISASKNRDYERSAAALKQAYQLASVDPLTLLYAGNISFLMGSTEAMERFYGDLLAKQPRNAEAKFNLAMAHVKNSGFAATDMISDAAKINPALVSEFMRGNERYFASDPPPLRKLMQPSLSPTYFWGHLFFADFFDAAEPRGGQWQLAYLCISVALFMVFLAMSLTVWSKKSKIRKYFICRICGRLLCKKCRKGTMCATCYKASVDSHNNAAAMYNLQNRHLRNAQTSRDFLKFALGIIVPGADRLYGGDSVLKPVLAIAVSSAIYAAYYCALTFHTAYPSRAAVNPLPYVSILLVYNIVAIVRQSLWLSDMLRMRAKTAVSQVVT